jgi:hypothetical protein
MSGLIEAVVDIADSYRNFSKALFSARQSSYALFTCSISKSFFKVLLSTASMKYLLSLRTNLALPY